jgi:hypothetical protein
MSIVKKEDVFDAAGLAAAMDAPKNTLNALTTEDFSRGSLSVDNAPSMTNATIFPNGHSVSWSFGSRLSISWSVHTGTTNPGDFYALYTNRIWDGSGSIAIDEFQSGQTDSPLNYNVDEEGWVIVRTSDPGTPSSHTASADNGSVPALVNFASTSSSLADKNITGILVRGTCETGVSKFDEHSSGVMLGIAVKIGSASGADEWHILPKSVGQFSSSAHQYTTVSTGCLISDTDIAEITHSGGEACSKLKDIALVACKSRFWSTVGEVPTTDDKDEYELGGYTLSCLPLLAGTLE